MEESLILILGRVSDWLKFAEAKNVVFIGFNGTAIFGVFNLLKVPTYPNWLIYCIELFIILSFVSLFLIFLSFLPRVHIPILKSISNTKGTDNLLFYGDIRKYLAHEYLRALKISRSINMSELNLLTFTKAELDYANQIIVISNIAYRKLIFFKVALYITLGALLTLGVSFSAYFIFIGMS